MSEFTIAPKALQRIYEHLHDAEDNYAVGELEELMEIAQSVVSDWESSRLAGHVCKLSETLKTMGAYDPEYTEDEL